jgi:hypothetical protein
MTFIPLNRNETTRRDLNETQPWAARQRAENEALPPTFSIWDRPVYQPPKEHCARAGAMDFMKVKSK